jgi:small subunit ribosomal protein S17
MNTSAVVKNKKQRQGVVVSNKMEKTVVVSVERTYRHPKYGKVVRTKRKYYAHDAQSQQREAGEKVTIEECRPLSKLKRWRVV